MGENKTEDWWQEKYPNFTLTRCKEMPIYKKFIENIKPFSRIKGTYREAF